MKFKNIVHVRNKTSNKLSITDIKRKSVTLSRSYTIIDNLEKRTLN